MRNKRARFLTARKEGANSMAIIGIDLGTSNSLVCVWTETGAQLIPNGLGDVLTPSAVSLDEDGTLLVGKPARERLVTAPEQTASEFKRFMGADKRYSLGAKSFTPEELSSFILRKLKDDAETWLASNLPGETVAEAIVSVPAYFNDNQRAATKRAGHLAGLKVDRLLNEPSAAALACRLCDQHTDYTALVFDFGGGTLDVSIVDCFDNMVSVLAVAGDNHLGGADFDRLIAQEFCKVNHLFFEQLTPQMQASLIFQAEDAKKRLTESDQTSITFSQGGISGTMELSNQRLIDICAPLFARMSLPVRRALADSRKHLNKIERIIMVGGSCKMPVVREYLHQLVGRELENPFAPDTVVGLGAGVYAGVRERREQIRDIVMTDLCPFTLGTGIIGKGDSRSRMSPIIERNSALPCSRSEQYFTAADQQKEICIDVYQGEGRYCSDNLLLGKLTVSVPPGQKGKESVDVRFTYDINGILEVEVTVPSTGEVNKKIFIGKGSNLTEGEIQARLAELATLKIHPHNLDGVKALLAHAERLYAQSMGDARDLVANALDGFQIVVKHGIPTDIARESERFKEFLDTAEKHIMGFGVFSFDYEQDESETEGDPGRDTAYPPTPPEGDDSGTPLQ